MLWNIYVLTNIRLKKKFIGSPQHFIFLIIQHTEKADIVRFKCELVSIIVLMHAPLDSLLPN